MPHAGVATAVPPRWPERLLPPHTLRPHRRRRRVEPRHRPLAGGKARSASPTATAAAHPPSVQTRL
eukprot:7361-Chlamydomonas_euryale.AAC.1